MTVKEIFKVEIVDQKIIEISTKYEQTIDAFVRKSLPRPARFKNIVVNSDFDDRYKFQQWVREEVEQPLGRFILDDMKLCYSRDLFTHVREEVWENCNTSPRDWYAMAWGDYFEELIFCCYEFEDSVANVQIDLMDGFLAQWIDYHKNYPL